MRLNVAGSLLMKLFCSDDFSSITGLSTVEKDSLRFKGLIAAMQASLFTLVNLKGGRFGSGVLDLL